LAYFVFLMALTSLVRSKAEAVSLSEDLDDVALTTLLDCGLSQRHPTLVKGWRSEQAAIKQANKEALEKRRTEMLSSFEAETTDLERDIRHGFVNDVHKNYLYAQAFDFPSVLLTSMPSSLGRTRLYARPADVGEQSSSTYRYTHTFQRAHFRSV
jgi:hypothetical protein